MQRGLYIAGSGMSERSFNLDVLSHNISNLQTNTYKRDRVAYTSFHNMLIRRIDEKNVSEPIGQMQFGTQVIAKSYTDFNQGVIDHTGDEQDLALEGKGFFKVMLPDGSTRLTREGRYMINSENILTDRIGNKFLDDKGNEILITERGKLTISQDGEIIANDTRMGRIGIYEVDDLSLLSKDGDTFYTYNGNEETGVKLGESTRVMQGYEEKSNFSPVGLLTEMIGILREYEASQKAVQVIDESIDQSIQTLGTIT